LQEGLQQGLQQGLQKGVRMTALGMHKIGLSIDVIAKATGQDEDTIRQWIAEAQQAQNAHDRPNDEG